jgi:hypothetical protein
MSTHEEGTTTRLPKHKHAEQAGTRDEAIVAIFIEIPVTAKNSRAVQLTTVPLQPYRRLLRPFAGQALRAGAEEELLSGHGSILSSDWMDFC